jgi:aminopeptidase N
MRIQAICGFGLGTVLLASAAARGAQKTEPAPIAEPTHADLLRGGYGELRANNDLLRYKLEVRVDPQKKFLSGKNRITFRMLQDGTRIQLDLSDTLKVEKILLGQRELKYERDAGAVFVDFPRALKKGRTYSIDFFYSGYPVAKGRFGGITFQKDGTGKEWITTSCEDDGASIWWPNKDQWRDEVKDMEIDVAVPNGLMDVSNGKFAGKKELGDGYTQWKWKVHYPINNYDVALNIGDYVHFGDRLGKLKLDYYVLPANLEKAEIQFTQVKPMMNAYQHYFGEYPFTKDGYKLVEVPYAGMEHQSAVAYGNHYENGYLGRDWTGVGISKKFDFIIIHESGHEWFGNAVTAADMSDMWIHEGWTTYMEGLYVEYLYGKPDAIRYLNGLKRKVKNDKPIVVSDAEGKTIHGVNQQPTQDMYFKGALMINTLRSVIDDDPKWFELIQGFYQEFKYRNILTEDVVTYFNEHSRMDLSPIFDQYLRHAEIPALELKFGDGTVSYRWKSEVKGFAMPVRVGSAGKWESVRPTEEWQTMKTSLGKEEFAVDGDDLPPISHPLITGVSRFWFCFDIISQPS